MSRFAILLLLATWVLNPVYGAQVLNKNLGWYGNTLDGFECNGSPQGFGPFDYNDPRSSTPGGFSSVTGSNSNTPLRMVEGAHFKPYIDQLIRGKSSVDPKPDIDYTLRAFPNHPRALWAMARYFLRMPKDHPDTQLAYSRGIGSIPPPECYFQRAKVFAPEDPMVSMVFGIYLHKRGMFDAAIKEYRLAERAMPTHAELAYNTGLAYFDIKDYQKANKYANRAYELGYPLPGLKRKLAKVKLNPSPKPKVD